MICILFSQFAKYYRPILKIDSCCWLLPPLGMQISYTAGVVVGYHVKREVEVRCHLTMSQKRSFPSGAEKRKKKKLEDETHHTTPPPYCTFCTTLNVCSEFEKLKKLNWLTCYCKCSVLSADVTFK